MERLYLPPSLRYFDPMRVIAREPLSHVCLIYDLVEALRPRLTVDVGAGAGIGFSVACQSLRDHDVDGLAYAVDSWADDEGKAENDPTSWAELNAFLRNYFRGVTYLMKMPPADARQHFAPGSIDLLRLNAPRAGEPLAVLIEAWLPRLAPGGFLLCPGVADPGRTDLEQDFERALSPTSTLVFPHGGGLGVFWRAPEPAGAAVPELIELLTSQDSEDRAGLTRFYEHADRYQAYRADTQELWAELVKKK